MSVNFFGIFEMCLRSFVSGVHVVFFHIMNSFRLSQRDVCRLDQRFYSIASSLNFKYYLANILCSYFLNMLTLSAESRFNLSYFAFFNMQLFDYYHDNCYLSKITLCDKTKQTKRTKQEWPASAMWPVFFRQMSHYSNNFPNQCILAFGADKKLPSISMIESNSDYTKCNRTGN